MLRTLKPALLCLGLALAFPLAGCVVEERRPVPPPEAAVYVPQPPPAPVTEVQPAPPGPPAEWIWKPGHYRWNGVAYVWHRGFWERRPERVVEWIPPHWENRPGGWVFIEGHYR